MSKSYQRRLAKIKQQHPRAYERWSEEEELRVIELVRAGRKPEEIARELQRRPSAIRSRLSKMKWRFRQEHESWSEAADMHLVRLARAKVGKDEIAYALQSQSQATERQLTQLDPSTTQHPPLEISRSLAESGPIVFELSLKWQPVNRGDGHAYLFPQPITRYMNIHYRRPSIYRLVASQAGLVQPIHMYIGSAKRLCPNRIDGYLHPAGSKTNTRLNAQFRQDVEEGLNVRLEMLSSCRLAAADGKNVRFDIKTQARRIALEGILIDYYRQRGVDLLNL